MPPAPNEPPEARDEERGANASSTQAYITFAQLVRVIESVLLKAGASPEVASVLGWNHASCERDGALSHGAFRVPQQVETLQTGYLDGWAEPVVEQVSSSYLRVDADSGPAQLAIKRTKDSIMRSVKKEGVAFIAIRDSHHHGALWPELEEFAETGCIALTTVTGGVPSVAPVGVTRPVLGTNPVAFATPVEGAHPLIADFATSSMSFGDLTLAARSGRAVPLGTGVDAVGEDTTDASAIAEGGVLHPFGGHKGTALSLMVEVLASALTGGSFSLETAQERPTAAHSSRTGQVLLVIDPDRGSAGGFASRVAGFVQNLREAGLERLPADHRHKTRIKAETRGIPITGAIRDLMEQCGSLD